MKVVRMVDTCQIKRGEYTVEDLQKGKFYIMSDAIHQMIQVLAPGVFGLEIPFHEVYNEYKGQSLGNKRVLAIRHGGGGDILFMSTAMKIVKRRNPEAKISLGVGAQYRPLVEGESEFYKIYDLPILLDDWNNYHYHAYFEGLIEGSREAEEFNAYDLFIKSVGYDPKEVPAADKIPHININAYALFRVGEVFDKQFKNGRPRVGIQAMTSTSIRNYPPSLWPAVAEKLIKRGFDVYFLGSTAQSHMIGNLCEAVGANCYNGVFEKLVDSLALASQMNYFIGPDSLFIHVAGALGRPVVGIYGPFKSALRMQYFKSAIGIDVEVGCSPCFMHGHFPCYKGDPSPCFSVISPDVVIKSFDVLKEEVDGQAAS